MMNKEQPQAAADEIKEEKNEQVAENEEECKPCNSARMMCVGGVATVAAAAYVAA